MLIYRIFYVKTGKSYIGQTKFASLKGRYWGKWYRSTHNQYLKNAVSKYGEESFAIQILEQEVSTHDELDRLEKHYIQVYNSLYPNGYNFHDGGNNNHSLHPETKRKIGEKNAKTFELVDGTGYSYKITNLKAFCRSRGLSYVPMKAMAAGKHLSSQGFALKGTPIEFIKDPNIVYILRHVETGQVVSFDNIRRFSVERGLEAGYVAKLLSGQRRSPYKGWVAEKTDLVLYRKKQSFIGKKLISPSGEIYVLNESPYSFAQKHPPLDRKDIYMLLEGRTENRKGGWKLYE